MKCARCDAQLIPEYEPPNEKCVYQFDNCLWIGFYGGYGMFVDNAMEARWPINTEDRWLRGDDGEYLTYMDENDRLCPFENPDYTPEFEVERILPGRPDYETVICHECAHFLCSAEPWLERLLNPFSSHAHRTAYHEAHPDHQGWDYLSSEELERRRNER